MELTSGVLVVQPPSDVARSPLTTRDTSHDGIGGIAPGAVAQTALLMGIMARGINDAHIATIVRVVAGTDTDHARSRALLTRLLAPKRCRRGWVPRIDPRAQDPPVSLHWPRTALAISLDANPSYAANSKGRENHPQKLHTTLRAPTRARLYWTLYQLRATYLPNPHGPLLPGRVHHQVHHHPSLRLPTFLRTAFDATFRLKWTSTSRRPMTPAWTSRRW